MTVGNWKTHLIVECDTCKKPMGFHTEMFPKLCNTCKRITTTTTVYCARWKAHGESCQAESILSWDALESKVFGQAYSPNRADVTFTSYQRRQQDS